MANHLKVFQGGTQADNETAFVKFSDRKFISKRNRSISLKMTNHISNRNPSGVNIFLPVTGFG